jgi:hypothetical protein
MARVSDGFSRFLLITVGIELVTIPFAQYVPLLLAEQSGRGLNQLLTIRRLFWFISHDRELAGMIWDRKSSMLVIEQLRNRAFSLDCPPFFRSEIQVFPAAHTGRTAAAILGFLSKEATKLHYFFEGI